MLENNNEIKCIILAYGINANEIADRIESFAFDKKFAVEETIINENGIYDKIVNYIKEGNISAILVRSILDIPVNIEEVKSLIKIAEEYDVSINEEKNGWNRLKSSEEMENDC